MYAHARPQYRLDRPMVVAIATDKYLTPKTPFRDTTQLPGGLAPKYGQDILFGTGRAAPKGHSVGSTVAELQPKMEALLGVFASNDGSGMAKRLFSCFLARNSGVRYFDDPSLNAAAGVHGNIQYFCSAALSAPNSPHRSEGKTRIHQALKNADWDISCLQAPTDLGVPAFNVGNKARGTGDFGNGLGVMINGVQHVYVVAESYNFDPRARAYSITLKYVFYDVFGLDDEDLEEYGATSTRFSSDAAIGITAWWQLQHQHCYPPLVTRIVHRRSFHAPAT